MEGEKEFICADDFDENWQYHLDTDFAHVPIGGSPEIIEKFKQL